MADDAETGPLVWGFAETPAEREEVYSFRYAHYYRNLPAAPGVDHEAGRVHLPVDEVSTHLTGRDKDGNLVIAGTGTGASTPDLPEEWRVMLRLDVLATLGLERILIFARMVEHEAYRGSQVFPAFYRFSAAHFVERGYAYSVHYCAPALVPLYERAGYRIYGPGYTMQSGLFRVPMILAGADTAYLARLNPSFAEAVDGVSADLKRFRAALPETARLPLCAMTAEERLKTLRAILAPNLRPGDSVEGVIPDAAAKPLRRASLLTLAPGDAPAAPTDHPLLWLVLEGEMVPRLRNGSETLARPGDCLNGHAISSFSAPRGGSVVAFSPGHVPEFNRTTGSGQALESGQAVFPADFCPFPV